MTSPNDASGKRIDYTRPQGQGSAPTSPGGQPAPGPPAPPPARRAGVPWTTYAITIVVFLLVLVVVVFITQNTYRVPIKFFGTTKYASVAGALAGAAAVGFVAGLLLGLIPQIRLRRDLRAYRRGKS